MSFDQPLAVSIQRVAEAPDGSRRPSGVFVAIVVLPLGGAAILAGRVVGRVSAARLEAPP